MAIDLNFGQHFHYNSSSWIIDILTAAFGAILGFLFAFQIYKIGEKKQKRNEYNRLVSSHTIKLNYLLLFVNSATEMAKEQLEKYKSYAKQIKGNPYTIHTPVIIASFDLERTKDYSSNELFEAYLFFNRNEDLQAYQDIFVYVDFLLKRFNENQNGCSRFITEAYKLTKAIADKTDKIGMFLIKKADSIKEEKPSDFEDDPEFIYLYKYITINQEIAKGEFDIKRIDEDFLQPLINVNNYITDPVFCIKLYSKIKSAQGKIRNIKENSLRYSDFFEKESVHNRNLESIQKLSEAKSKIELLIKSFEKDE